MLYRVFTEDNQSVLVYNEELKELKECEDYSHNEEINYCEVCNKDDYDLEIVGSMARCRKCTEKYYK